MRIKTACSFIGAYKNNNSNEIDFEKNILCFPKFEKLLEPLHNDIDGLVIFSIFGKHKIFYKWSCFFLM